MLNVSLSQYKLLQWQLQICCSASFQLAILETFICLHNAVLNNCSVRLLVSEAEDLLKRNVGVNKHQSITTEQKLAVIIKIRASFIK